MLPYFKHVTLLLLIFISSPCIAQTHNRLVQHSVTNSAGLKLNKNKNLKFGINTTKPGYKDEIDTYIDFQLGYSPFKYVGVQAGHYRFNSVIQNQESSKVRLHNLSIGTYVPIDLTNVINAVPYYPRIFPDSLLLELYGGTLLGKAISRNSNNATPEDFHVSTLRMQNYFLRVGWTYHLWKLSFNSNYMWGYLNYYKGVYDYARGGSLVFDYFNQIKADNDASYYEVTHQLSFNGKEMQFHFGMSRIDIKEPSNIRFKEEIWFAGLTFDIQAILNHNKNYRAKQ